MSQVPARIEIPLFRGGKRIAVTTSWDDGTIHDRRVVAGLNALGLKGTFNLNSGLLIRPGATPDDNWHIAAAEVVALYAGHEVAVHALTHPWLDRLDPAQIAAEVLHDRQALEELVGYPVRGMAYPYGTYNQQVIDVLRALGIVYSRTVENRDNPWPWPEPLAWPATMHMFNDQPAPLPERFEKFYAAWDHRNTGLFYVWGHSYEFATDDPKRHWDNFDRLFAPLAGKPDVWYATNIDLFDYEAARQRLVIAANRRSAYNPSGMAVTLRVDGHLVDVPPGRTIPLGS